MGGEKNTALLKAGSGQAYKNATRVNGKGNQLVNVGIYCSPHIQITFGYSNTILRPGTN